METALSLQSGFSLFLLYLCSMDSPEVIVTPVTEDREYEMVFDIRRKVFVDEQNVPEEDEFDGHEPIAHHYLAVCEGIPCGAARWRITLGRKLKLERFAVLKEFRGKGIGRALVERILKDIPEGYDTYLHAQTQVLPFYESFGFVAEGDEFDECGIMHYKMTLHKK